MLLLVNRCLCLCHHIYLSLFLLLIFSQGLHLQAYHALLIRLIERSFELRKKWRVNTNILRSCSRNPLYKESTQNLPTFVPPLTLFFTLTISPLSLSSMLRIANNTLLRVLSGFSAGG